MLFCNTSSVFIFSCRVKCDEVEVEIDVPSLGLGRSVLRTTVPEVLSTALGLRPRAVLKTSGTVVPNTDLPAGKQHIYVLITILHFTVVRIHNFIRINLVLKEVTPKNVHVYLLSKPRTKFSHSQIFSL